MVHAYHCRWGRSLSPQRLPSPLRMPPFGVCPPAPRGCIVCDCVLISHKCCAGCAVYICPGVVALFTFIIFLLVASEFTYLQTAPHRAAPRGAQTVEQAASRTFRRPQPRTRGGTPRGVCVGPSWPTPGAHGRRHESNGSNIRACACMSCQRACGRCRASC